MFLRDRATQAEYFDAPERTPAELRQHYAQLGRINRLTQFDRPFRIWVPQLLAEPASLTFLDLGSGDGSLGQTLHTWAARQNWSWEFTHLDVNPVTREIDSNPRHVLGSVTALPFPNHSHDVVIATTMTHHLSEAEVIQHFREAQRVAKRLVLICDLHRNRFFWLALGALLWAIRLPREFRQDGLLSVERGWQVPEWRRLAEEAGLTNARVWQEHGTRILLAVVKDGYGR